MGHKKIQWEEVLMYISTRGHHPNATSLGDMQYSMVYKQQCDNTTKEGCFVVWGISKPFIDIFIFLCLHNAQQQLIYQLYKRKENP